MSGATAVTIGTAVAGAAATALIGNALAPKQKNPELVRPMPMPHLDEVQANKRRAAIADQMKRQGRASTILSDGNETLG